jgi:hypothetical protein
LLLSKTQLIKTKLQGKISIPSVTIIEAQQRLKTQSQSSLILKTGQQQNQGASSSHSAIMKLVARRGGSSPTPNLTHN